MSKSKVVIAIDSRGDYEVLENEGCDLTVSTDIIDCTCNQDNYCYCTEHPRRFRHGGTIEGKEIPYEDKIDPAVCQCKGFSLRHCEVHFPTGETT